MLKESKVGGRIAVYVPDHPAANNRGYVLRYRYVMEQMLGRFLNSNEHVHHKNGDCLDDSPENLELMTCSEHTKKHWVLGKHTLHRPGKKRSIDREEVARLRAEGLGCRRIAAILGCAKSGVQRIFHEFGA